MFKYIITLLAMLMLSEQAFSETITQDYVNETFTRISKEEGVPKPLLRSICWAESKLVSEAYNHGDGAGTNHAFGICQMLHSTARQFGFRDDNCTKDFSKMSSRTYKGCKLFGVETNVRLAAKFLKTKLDQYDGSWIHAIAAYNAGSVRICKTGFVTRAKDHTVLWKCKKGGLLNQHYVDDVLKALQENR